MALPFVDDKLPSFDNFAGDTNLRGMSLLRHFVETKSESMIYLLGPESTGKTHLLLAASKELDEAKVSNGYLSAALLNDMAPSEIRELLGAVENYQFILLDDLDALVWTEVVAEAFFGLVNFVRDTGRCLLMASAKSVEQLDIRLADLVSRLNAGVVIRLQSVDEQQKLELLKELARNKGLSLNDESLAFIIKRSQRDVGSLIKVLEALDRAAWEAQHKLTIPFIKSVMYW